MALLTLPVLEAAPSPTDPKTPWLKMRLPTGETDANLRKSLRERDLYTVCEEARRLNLDECWACPRPGYEVHKEVRPTWSRAARESREALCRPQAQFNHPA